MLKQYIGVVPFKRLIKWSFPDAVKAFDHCAKGHDEAYESVDWSKGDSATAIIDNVFYKCCIAKAGNDTELQRDADLFFKVCRVWGRMRARLWAWGVRY